MRCLARVRGFAGALRALDLMVLRVDDFAAACRPVHFLVTAGCAAGRDAVALDTALLDCCLDLCLDLCLSGMCASLFARTGKANTNRAVAAPAMSMQPEHAVDGAQFGGLDQLRMRHGDREQGPVELFLPEGEEI